MPTVLLEPHPGPRPGEQALGKLIPMGPNTCRGTHRDLVLCASSGSQRLKVDDDIVVVSADLGPYIYTTTIQKI